MIQFLALGDSYTIGEAVTPSERWPSLLAAQLRKEGFPVAEPLLVARTGWTSVELEAALEDQALEDVFDLVSLLVGVNDQYRGTPPDQYDRTLRRLISRAVAFARGYPHRVLVISIPDWSVTRFADGRNRVEIGRRIDELNELAESATREAGANWIDVTAESRRAAFDSGLIAEDGLHPSMRMYAEWVACITPVALGVLRSGRR
ncbi:MAG: GDSL-type esterase/lipase family protein [Thermoanaerobaculia bacterium]